MSLFDKIKVKNYTKKELQDMDELDLEPGDLPAMIIAAIVTFFPVLIVAMVVVYGSYWLLFT